MTPRRHLRQILAALAAGAIALAGCAGGTGQTALSSEPAESEATGAQSTAPADVQAAEGPEESAEAEAAAPPGQNQLPPVAVIDVATGAEVNLAEYAPAETPIVLWFWAPH